MRWVLREGLLLRHGTPGHTVDRCKEDKHSYGGGGRRPVPKVPAKAGYARHSIICSGLATSAQFGLKVRRSAAEKHGSVQGIFTRKTLHRRGQTRAPGITLHEKARRRGHPVLRFSWDTRR